MKRGKLAEAGLPAKLRIGVMLDGTVVPSWIQSILVEINSSDHAELVLAIFNDAPKTKRTLWQKFGMLKEYAFGVFHLIDAKLFSRNVALDAFAPKDVSELLVGVPQLQVIPLPTKFVDRFSEDDVNAIRAAQLDVILRFGFRIIKGDVLQSARYGVWSYHHGDNDFYRGGPALFWEMYEKNPISGTVLQILNEELDGGTVIYKSYSATDRFALFIGTATPRTGRPHDLSCASCARWRRTAWMVSSQ